MCVRGGGRQDNPMPACKKSPPANRHLLHWTLVTSPYYCPGNETSFIKWKLSEITACLWQDMCAWVCFNCLQVEMWLGVSLIQRLHLYRYIRFAMDSSGFTMGIGEWRMGGSACGNRTCIRQYLINDYLSSADFPSIIPGGWGARGPKRIFTLLHPIASYIRSKWGWVQ